MLVMRLLVSRWHQGTNPCFGRPPWKPCDSVKVQDSWEPQVLPRVTARAGSKTVCLKSGGLLPSISVAVPGNTKREVMEEVWLACFLLVLLQLPSVLLPVEETTAISRKEAVSAAPRRQLDFLFCSTTAGELGFTGAPPVTSASQVYSLVH